MLKLHLGCGSKYLEGWVNIDRRGKHLDQRLDLRKPLPYKKCTVDFIFNEHFLEHLTRLQAFDFLKECHRILQVGGILRVTTPDLSFMVHCYQEGKVDEWNDEAWFPSTRCQMINEGMRDWGHKFLYDREELSELLRYAGFSAIKSCSYRSSKIDCLRNLESRNDHRELIMEAIR
jgi:predicted SAM-dependent methyltransferase